jgi:hypothetical protein
MKHATRTTKASTLAFALLALAAGAPAAQAETQEPARGAERGAEAEAREAAREVLRRENDQLRRRARIERLIDVYRAEGRDARVRQLEELREREENAHRALLTRLEQRMGPERYRSLQSTRRAEIAERVRLVQQQRERAAAASRSSAPRADEPRRPDPRVATRPAPRSGSRPDRPRSR